MNKETCDWTGCIEELKHPYIHYSIHRGLKQSLIRLFLWYLPVTSQNHFHSKECLIKYLESEQFTDSIRIIK